MLPVSVWNAKPVEQQQQLQFFYSLPSHHQVQTAVSTHHLAAAAPPSLLSLPGVTTFSASAAQLPTASLTPPEPLTLALPSQPTDQQASQLTLSAGSQQGKKVGTLSNHSPFPCTMHGIHSRIGPLALGGWLQSPLEQGPKLFIQRIGLTCSNHSSGWGEGELA